MMRICLFFLVYLFFHYSKAQILPLNDYLKNVLIHHPKTKIAALYLQQSDGITRMAKGGFDPKISSQFLRKDLGNQNYYGLFQAKLEIPLLPGIDLIGGAERNYGAQLDPSDFTVGTLFTAGLKVPLAQGLLFDERRRNLQVAQSQKIILTATQKQILNKLIWDATKAYADYYAAFEKLYMGREAVGLARIRYQNVLTQIKLGDLPAMDSLEAFIEVQRREITLKELTLTFANAYLNCQLLLWGEAGKLDTARRPSPSTAFFPAPYDSLSRMMERAYSIQPAIQILSGEAEILNTEKKWNREQLKPKLDVIYQPLFNQKYPLGTMTFSDNIKWGTTFSMPIWLRKERGKLLITETKLNQQKLKISIAERELATNIQTAFNEYIFHDSLIQIQQVTVDNYRQLVNLEIRKFNQGESTQFVVNTRERTYIEAKIKLAELEAKRLKAIAEIYYHTGDISGLILP